MRALKLDMKEAEFAFGKLAEDYTVVAPKRCPGRGRLSDTDLITYEEVESLGEIEFAAKTYFSAKSILFPVREAAFSFADGGCEEVLTDLPATIMFLRACDIHALAVLDAMFLEHGGRSDCYYARRRENMTCFLLECPTPFDGCFCVSMGTNQTDDYAAFIRETSQGYEVQMLDKRFQQYFTGGTEACVEPRFANEAPVPVRIPGQIDTSLFSSPLWDEYSERCIACGRCNTSCPTCTCFSVQDIPDKDDPSKSTRQRMWSSCQSQRFSRLAGNHDFRISKGERMRYKVLHKISDFAKKFGFHMCVGCGRCEDVCPEYISMRKCIGKIATISQDDVGVT